MKLVLVLVIGLLLQSCGGIGMVIGSVATSPKLLVYTTHRSYEKKIDMTIMINDRQHEVNATIKCTKEGVYFGWPSTASWEEKWNIMLVNNEIISSGKKYKIVLGDFDPKRKIYYNYKFRRDWCNGFLKDSEAIKRVDNDNSLVLDMNESGMFKNQYNTIAYGKIHNRSFLYLTHEEPDRETWQGSDYKYIAKNATIKSIKIYNELK